MTANSVHYRMEVRPLSGTDPFRCECEPPSLMLSFKSPPFGVLVKMECVPSKKKARFDRNDPAISKKEDSSVRHTRLSCTLTFQIREGTARIPAEDM